MKYILSTLALVLISFGAQAQSLHFSVDAGNGAYVENTRIGVGWGIGNDYTFRVQSGFSQTHARGHYMDIGFAVDKILPVSFFNTSPLISANVRGYSGENHTVGNGSGLDSGIAYGLFAGLNHGRITVGTSIESYSSYNKIWFVNPLSIRLSF